MVYKMAPRKFAGIEYHGHPGTTRSCVRSIERLLYLHCDTVSALIISCEDGSTRRHAFMLTSKFGDQTAIKNGFNSGYSGEGPRGLSRSISLITWSGIEIDEVDVDGKLIDRLDNSSLTVRDLSFLQKKSRVRPTRLYDYIIPPDELFILKSNPWINTIPDLPLSLIDPRIGDLAREFKDDPDANLIKAHRRLEDIIRKRINYPKQDGIFAFAFNKDNARLTWEGISQSEQQGRANLFIGYQMAYRNNRMHLEEEKTSIIKHIQEFIIVNHLYRLEACAVQVVDNSENKPLK